MITRTIVKTIATITCSDGYVATKTFYGNGITGGKVRKAFLKEEPSRDVVSVSIASDEIKVGMTDAEFVANGRVIEK